MFGKEKILAALAAVTLLVGGVVLFSAYHPLAAQTSPQPTIPPVRIFAVYPLVPISATAALGSAATLTIPAPGNAVFFNYVCYLALEASAGAGTVAPLTNVVTTSTNFNGFAAKFSNPGAVSTDTGVLTLINSTAPGCAKSAAAGVATTFTSPTNANEAFNWMAVYLQAP